MTQLVDAGSASASSGGASYLRRLLSLSPWGYTVVTSFLVLAFAATAMGALRLTSARSSSAAVGIREQLTRVELSIARGSVVVLGGGAQSPVTLRHRDRSTFGHGPSEERSLRGGVLRVTSRCPAILLGDCSSDYQLIVPDNVQVTVRALDGAISLDAFHGSADLESGSGRIRVDAFCGYVLNAQSGSGRIDVATSCSPESLQLRSISGDIAAVVPPGRYALDTASGSGHVEVRGLSNDVGAPWSISAISSGGDVSVEAAQ